MGGVHLHMRTCASADVPQCSVYLGNGRTDCDDIWCVVRDQLCSYAFHTTQGWGISARAHVRTLFPYLGNRWTDCTKIWYVVRDQLARQFTQTKGWAHLHVSTCLPFFRVSGTAERIALKFGMLL